MSRNSWTSIYDRELQKLLDEGWPEETVGQEATIRTDEIYWDLVDQGRQRAKDKDVEIERIPPGGDDE